MSKPKHVRLLSGLLDGEGKVDESRKFIDKPAMLVYVGKFESMDGEVEITAEDISKLAENHNGMLAKLSRLATGQNSHRFNPPIQLDHSTSARDTVGRLIGNLTVGEHTDESGNKIPALLGTARILGAENVEKVEDGRWVNLSGGFDLETHMVTELTITPFPAAADAALLSKKRMAFVEKYKGCDIVTEKQGIKFVAAVRESGKSSFEEVPGEYDTETAAVNAGKKYIDKQFHLSKGEEEEMPNYKEMKERMSMYEKCKKHLMDKENLSEEAVEERLAALSDEDVQKMSAERDEEEKKLAAEKEEEEKKLAAEKEAELKRLSSVKEHKEKLVELSKGMKATREKVQLAAKKSRIQVRLAKLAAAQKVTPAEIKSINIVELAGKSDEAVEAALSSYEKREPVIDVGMYGTTKALTASQLHAKLKKIGNEASELKARLSMPMKREAALKRLSELGLTESDLEKPVSIHIDNVPQGEHDVDADAAYEEMKRLIGEGKDEEAKMKFKSHLGGGQVTAPMGDPTEEISALAEEVKRMQTGYDDFVKLAAPIFGVTNEELSQ